MILRSISVAISLFASSAAFGQAQPAKNEVSDKTLKTLKSLAWQSLPTKIVLSKDKIVQIDKSDPSKIIIPDADARAIIKDAYLTARAHKCDLQELVIANRNAILLREKARNKWSESQLHYINALHLYTVQLLVGKVEVVNADKAQPTDSQNLPMPDAGHQSCSDKEKQDITKAVAANEKLVGKS